MKERERGTQSCSGLQMIKYLMGYVMNCSHGWARRGRDESKIQRNTTVLANALQYWLFRFTLLSAHARLKLQLRHRKLQKQAGAGVMQNKRI